MSTSAKSLRFDDRTMWVELADGRVLGVPLAWFPRLERACPADREAYRISPSGQGLHWEALDEDISVSGLLSGRYDCDTAGHHVASSYSRNRSRRRGGWLQADNLTTAYLVGRGGVTV